MRQVDPDRYPGVSILQRSPSGLQYCVTDFATTSRCPVQPNLPKNLNSSLGPKKRSESRLLGTLQDRRVRSPPEPPRNDIFALHADMSHQRNCNLQKFYPDKVKKR
jgi:hypothetical protein